MECIARTASGRKCKLEATHHVEKNDLSHRVADYCEEHAAPYSNYPMDFKVTKIRKIH